MFSKIQGVPKEGHDKIKAERGLGPFQIIFEDRWTTNIDNSDGMSRHLTRMENMAAIWCSMLGASWSCVMEWRPSRVVRWNETVSIEPKWYWNIYLQVIVWVVKLVTEFEPKLVLVRLCLFHGRDANMFMNLKYLPFPIQSYQHSKLSQGYLVKIGL